MHDDVMICVNELTIYHIVHVYINENLYTVHMYVSIMCSWQVHNFVFTVHMQNISVKCMPNITYVHVCTCTSK